MVIYDLQICDRIAYFFAVRKTQPAVYTIRDPAFGKGAFNTARLRIHAVKDRKITVCIFIGRDMLQDKALASQLPVVVYKPQSVLGQAIYRIADKIISTVPHQFDAAFNPDSFSTDNFQLAEEDAAEDYNLKLSGIDDIVSSGTLSMGELAEMIKTQQYEINQLKKENNLLKSKLVKASEQGFRI